MRQFLHSPSPAASPQPQPHVNSRFPHPLATASTTTAFSLLLFLLVCFQKITGSGLPRNPTLTPPPVLLLRPPPSDRLVLFDMPIRPRRLRVRVLRHNPTH
ncbi:hypothetical protein C1H46_042713 [Malus baccata]|uniref:Uncharacterized protein n=1 Tax=Malus baccata TaxID=106549 RepID=A0A540KBZ6_MALBA|nr:hypothetical protein C1H46_042713 [Malus baccata]